MSNIFEVQKVLSKRVVNNQVQYLLKWKGFNSKENSWVNVEKMDCQNSIDDFEKTRMLQVLTVRRQGNNVEYLMQTKDNSSEVVQSTEAKKYWPALVVDFLEKIVVSNIPPSNGQRQSFRFDDIVDEVEVDVERVAPTKISYVTLQMGKKFYLTEFENGGVRFFGSSEAKKRWPNMIIEYLEPMLQV